MPTLAKNGFCDKGNTVRFVLTVELNGPLIFSPKNGEVGNILSIVSTVSFIFV